MVITARVGFFAWLLAITLATAVSVACVVMWTHPEQPEPCHDSVTRLYGRDGTSCPSGSHMEITNVPQDGAWYPYSIVKCTCYRATPDAGTP